MLAELCNFPGCTPFAQKWESSVEGSDASRSWPFDTLMIGAFCTTFRALSDAPISIASGHDLTLLPSSPTFEQKVDSPESAQFGKHNSQLLQTGNWIMYHHWQ